MKYFLLLLVFICDLAFGQLLFNEQDIRLGTIEEAYEINGDVVLNNNSGKNIYLMRADADKGVKIYTSKKTLHPGDTALLIISFLPEKKGSFKKEIRLITSDQATAYELTLSGHIEKLKTNDNMACYYFGSRRQPVVKPDEGPLVTKLPDASRDQSNKIPDRSSEPTEKKPALNTPPPEKHNPRPTDGPKELPENLYRPNNVLFLVDVSGSMKDSLKLPLMKKALHTLIDAVRDIDTITFVTYADTIKIVQEAVSGKNKQQLHDMVHTIRARGMTKGRKALHYSQLVAQKHYIRNGNNQIIMASDGKFRFEDADFIKWKEQQGEKHIVLTTVAFGNDREAIRTLRDLATRGKGSFIHIRNREGSDQLLLNEIKSRSKI